MKMFFTLALVMFCVGSCSCIRVKSSPLIARRDTPYLYYYINDRKDTVRFTEDRLLILEGKLKVTPIQISVEPVSTDSTSITKSGTTSRPGPDQEQLRRIQPAAAKKESAKF